jgi:inactivated superfamily I helicase
MRAEFGIALPERAIGIAAHDFAQALGAPEVALTRAARREGAPTVPSRWLLRLDAVLRAVGLAERLGPTRRSPPRPLSATCRPRAGRCRARRRARRSPPARGSCR